MGSSFEESVKRYMDSYDMLTACGRVVVGLSGGADSVCLLLVLKRLGYEVHALHVNHMIRGGEADRDESFVRELCEREGIELTVVRKDVPALAKELHMSEEEAGRHIRYEAFEELATQLGESGKAVVGNKNAVKIAVAHNKNDLAETVIYNMIRGSSLQGIAGIRPVRGRIIRPLLMTKRTEIENYLSGLGQGFITDSTNLKTDYTRNRIRLEVLPILEELNDGAVDHLAAASIDALKLRNDMDRRLSNGQFEFTKDISRIDIGYLKELEELSQGELILRAMASVCGRRKDLTREHVQSVIGLAELESGKKISLPYGMVAERVYSEIRITASGRTEQAGCGDGKKQAGCGDGNEQAVSGDGKKSECGADARDEKGEIGCIEIRELENSSDLDLSKKEYTKLIDCDKIKSALCLRYPQAGDFLVINQNGGRKKLSRYFTEVKIERSLRDKVPVVADGDEIVWVVGYRLSENYKVTPSTRQVTEIRYIKEAEV
ncbi:MAG: tRNA lysidine(34) synthetase TilS [Eubacterium sp.]|nr:tRNA lysidine(34) synthetase TilS [Eubacterium sp.]